MTLSLAEKSRLAMEAVANQMSEIQYIQGENTRMVREKDKLQSQLLRQLSANQLAQQQNQQGGHIRYEHRAEHRDAYRPDCKSNKKIHDIYPTGAKCINRECFIGKADKVDD